MAAIREVMQVAAAITVIELWPFVCDCARCEGETSGRLCWPFYQEFLHSANPYPAKGYVPVCEWCYRWLDEHDDELYKGTFA